MDSARGSLGPPQVPVRAPLGVIVLLFFFYPHTTTHSLTGGSHILEGISCGSSSGLAEKDTSGEFAGPTPD